ncbi:NUDIX hydrolase [Candidatus Oscillochloris fontis]|uniref:NUDIX hydrolase n=1 Tax=Candidatus Oscillochloris fontis TaxID=2496868 RepID=UPI00101DA161|nr:NUDIX domain-containing protein [Candidatus Oscillochloris fontis]
MPDPCDQITPPSILAVGGVIYRCRRRDGKPEILIIKKRNGFWTLPKGRIEPGEHELAALHREIGEETGLRVVLIATGETLTYQIVKGQVVLTKQVHYFLVRANGGKLRLSKAEKIEHARWCTLRVAMERIHNPRLHGVVRWAAHQLGITLPR